MIVDRIETRLSEHFEVSDFEDEQISWMLNIDNTMPPEVFLQLQNLCQRVLEPVIAHFDCHIVIRSGYRSPMLNAAVGCAPESLHTLGQAVDFVCYGKTPMWGIFEWMETHVPYDELTYKASPDTEHVWIHVSLREEVNRGMSTVQILEGPRVEVVLPEADEVSDGGVGEAPSDESSAATNQETNIES